MHLTLIIICTKFQSNTLILIRYNIEFLILLRAIAKYGELKELSDSRLAGGRVMR